MEDVHTDVTTGVFKLLLVSVLALISSFHL